MTRTDWLGLGLLVFLAAALIGAFFLYLRTAYRKGGWREVKVSFIIAIVSLVAFCIVRVAQNSELHLLKDAVNRLTR